MITSEDALKKVLIGALSVCVMPVIHSLAELSVEMQVARNVARVLVEDEPCLLEVLHG